MDSIGLPEIKRNGVDWPGDIGNFPITWFAKYLIEGGIDRDRFVPIFLQHLHRLIGITLWLRRRADNGDRF